MMKQRILKTMKKSLTRVILTVNAIGGEVILKENTLKEKVQVNGAKDMQEKT